MRVRKESLKSLVQIEKKIKPIIANSKDYLCLVLEAFNNFSLADDLKMINKTNSEKSGKKEKKMIS